MGCRIDPQAWNEPVGSPAVLNPAVDRRLVAGDRLVVVAPVTVRKDLERLSLKA